MCRLVRCELGCAVRCLPQKGRLGPGPELVPLRPSRAGSRPAISSWRTGHYRGSSPKESSRVASATTANGLGSSAKDWGYDRIVGALANLGCKVCDQTVGNLRRDRDRADIGVM